jgi:hypothetical protein
VLSHQNSWQHTQANALDLNDEDLLFAADKLLDSHRVVPVDARRLLLLIRFHPAATKEFMEEVQRDIAEAGFHVPLEVSAFTF